MVDPAAAAAASYLTVIVGCVVAQLIGALIGAFFLRAACWLFNKFAGGPEAPGAISEPSFGKGFQIIFLASLSSFCISFGIGFMLGREGIALGPAESLVLGFPISILTLSGAISILLPTSFIKGLAVVGLYLVVAICVATMIIIPILAIVPLLSA